MLKNKIEIKSSDDKDITIVTIDNDANNDEYIINVAGDGGYSMWINLSEIVDLYAARGGLINEVTTWDPE